MDSNAARIRAPPYSIVDGPNNIVAATVAQSGVPLTAPSKFCTSLMLTLLKLVMIVRGGCMGAGLRVGVGVRV